MFWENMLHAQINLAITGLKKVIIFFIADILRAFNMQIALLVPKGGTQNADFVQ